MSQDIEDLIRNCGVRNESATAVKKPLLPTATPSIPLKIPKTDLFYHERKAYLLVKDYYSGYSEIALVASESSRCVIQHWKGIFARHGIPEMVISDNGPQYSLLKFKEFASKY